MAHRPLCTAALCVFLFCPAPKGPQAQVIPAGSEFQINTYTTSTQRSPKVAGDADGDFVVVWASYGQDGSSLGVFGRRYNSVGSPAGGEFQVNTHTTSYQVYPAVAVDADGDFVVVWASYGQDGNSSGVFGQRYNSVGSPVGGEFQVNTYTTGVQRGIGRGVAADADGDFVVVWDSEDQDGSGAGVFARRYTSTGAPVGGEFQVNTHTTSDQRYSAVAADADGDFVVVWDSEDQDGDGWGVFGQRFSSAGSPVGSEFQVNTYTTGITDLPTVAADADGDFVVVWDNSDGQDGSYSGVFGQRYTSAGAPVGGEFQVNTYTTSYQWDPAVAADADGDFVVVWHSEFQDGSEHGIFAQRYASSGAPLGGEFQVNTYTTLTQYVPAVAASAGGNFVVVWYSRQDGSGYGIFGQRFFSEFSLVPVPVVSPLGAGLLAGALGLGLGAARRRWTRRSPR